jgi:hypothetical protein
MRAILAVALLAACTSKHDTKTTEPDGGGPGSGSAIDPNVLQDYNDVAATLGMAFHDTELPAMTSSFDLAYGTVPTGFTEQTPGQIALGSGAVTGTVDAIAYNLAYQCLSEGTGSGDAIGAVVEPCNGMEDHVRLVVEWAGSDTGSAAQMTDISERGVWYVRDLTVPEINVWLGGNGTTTLTNQLSTGVYSISYTNSSDHLAFDPTAPTLPTAGTDAQMLTVSRAGRAGVPDRMFDVVGAFQVLGNGTGELTLDTQMIYEVTLSTGAVTETSD